MIPVISIREATPADNILLADLGAKTFAQAFAAANAPSDMAAYLPSAFSPAIQATELANPENIFWLVYEREQLVGYVKLFTGPAAACVTQLKALKIARLYLLQPWYGQGIGHQILNRVLFYAQEQGFSVIWLTVWEHNPGALKLYTRLGFKPVGEEDFILGKDVQRDFIMEKVL